MLIHVNRDGEQFGPYTIEDLNAYLAQGSILPTDQAWYEGAAGWMPMDQVPGVVLPGAAADPMAQPAASDPLAAADPAATIASADTMSVAVQGAKKKENSYNCGCHCRSSSVGRRAMLRVAWFVE